MVKSQFVEQLKERDRLDGIFLVKSVRQAETKTGKPYLVVTVMDRTGEIGGPIWEDVEHYSRICQPGEIVRLRGVVRSFQGLLQLKIDDAERVGFDEIDLAFFLPCTKRDREEMALEFQKIIHSIEDPFVRKLLLKFFRKGNTWQKFQEAPAAKGIHHAYIGGLLEHTLSVTQIADQLCEHYQGVDRSLLLAGAMLHDIGKLEELEIQKGVIDYTSRGRLKGHLVIGSEMVGKAASEMEDVPLARLEQIQHLILSHHGRQEFGSPTVPMTVEAFLLSFLDDLDAKMNVTEQLRYKIDNGEMQWTDYQRSLERFLFLGGLGTNGERKSEDQTDGLSRQQSLF